MKSKTKRAAVQEKRVADSLGGRRQPGSGSRWHSRADAKAKRFLCECKYTDKKQFILKLSDIEKARKAALFEGREFAFQIDLAGRQLVVLDAECLVELEETAQNE